MSSGSKFRIGAVSYLNTVPLVWGMLHGPQKEHADVSFSLPAVCAQELENGVIQVGLAPVAEIARQGLEIVPGVGIACYDAVRSILLISKVPFRRIRTLAADSGSRTSVELARVILRERYGSDAAIRPHAPVLEDMLAIADAALVIGDPALRIDPAEVGYEAIDLGSEWLALTGLPMVFALWAGKPGLPLTQLELLMRDSYGFGKLNLETIIAREFGHRGISKELAGEYLRNRIKFEIGPAENKGLKAFLEMADLEAKALAYPA